jgi:hypothetical protein
MDIVGAAGRMDLGVLGNDRVPSRCRGSLKTVIRGARAPSTLRCIPTGAGFCGFFIAGRPGGVDRG